LNLSSDYYFVLISGRKIFLGGPYLNWSLGYPETKRVNQIGDFIKTGFEKVPFCKYLEKNNIKFIYIKTDEKKLIDMDFDPQTFVSQFKEHKKFVESIKK
jgi:hypothetical protein